MIFASRRFGPYRLGVGFRPRGGLVSLALLTLAVLFAGFVVGSLIGG